MEFEQSTAGGVVPVIDGLVMALHDATKTQAKAMKLFILIGSIVFQFYFCEHCISKLKWFVNEILF